MRRVRAPQERLVHGRGSRRHVRGKGRGALARGFAAGADEVLAPNTPDDEVAIRLDVMLRRADRDVHVHPSTRLPGAAEIEAAIGTRLAAGELFAPATPTSITSRNTTTATATSRAIASSAFSRRFCTMLCVASSPDGGFVGHIGGDDFILLVPMLEAPEICQEIVSIFDLLVPYQYSEQDRQAGYYFGKDRRGQLHRVPLMTVSIGVVTNERRTFSHPAQVSELATEMKSYAKTLNGSVYVVDRRQDPSLAHRWACPSDERNNSRVSAVA